MFQILPAAGRVLEMLESRGFEAWVVGGCVRDLLLGRTPHDWDITTNALPQETMEVFSGSPVIATGLRHGTVTVLMDGQPLEVTTYRVDGAYSDGRRPDGVRFVSSLREDLARRDFTLGAMAWSPRRGFRDPFGGREDLAAGVIRCVGDPEARFREDALRILRALRFAAVYDFAVEGRTAAALHGERELLGRIAWERVGSEIRRMAAGPGARRVLLEFPDVLAVPIPEIGPMVGFAQRTPWHHLDVWEHTALAAASAPPDEITRLALLFHDIAKPACFTLGADGTGHFYGHSAAGAKMAEEITARLRLDNGVRRAVAELVARHDLPLQPEPATVRRWLGRLGEEQLRRLIAVQKADALAQAPGVAEERLTRLGQVERLLDQVLEEKQCFSLKDLAVNGQDLLAEGVPPGPTVGRELRSLLELVVEGRAANDRDTLLKLVRNGN